MATLVLPPQFSKRILYTSFTATASVASAAYNRLPGCAICAIAVLLTSLNYWRRPIFGLRRNLDMAVCACALSYQTWLAAVAADPVPRGVYFAITLGGGGCYALSRYFSQVQGDKNVSSALHCCLHLAGNLGNVLLYDALGANHCGLRRGGG
uniref:Uncharacterized protein n=1 Tax=Haptolina ericina TaxID=156174 RepID=A0A7S3EW39_9EUKA